MGRNTLSILLQDPLSTRKTKYKGGRIDATKVGYRRRGRTNGAKQNPDTSETRTSRPANSTRATDSTTRDPAVRPYGPRSHGKPNQRISDRMARESRPKRNGLETSEWPPSIPSQTRGTSGQ